MSPKCLLLIFLLMAGVCPALRCQDSPVQSNGYRYPSEHIYTSPDPFTLDARASQTLIDVLRTQQFLIFDDGSGERSIVRVNEIWAEYRGIDDSLPVGFRRRYELILNGEPLDWPNYYIEWGLEMVNLQTLFTYNNQLPTPGLKFRTPPTP